MSVAQNNYTSLIDVAKFSLGSQKKYTHLQCSTTHNSSISDRLASIVFKASHLYIMDSLKLITERLNLKAAVTTSLTRGGHSYIG